LTARPQPPRNPSRRKSRRQPDTSAPAKWDARAVRRLAEEGAEQSDIAASLGLVPMLAADPDKRADFEAIVARGHAAFRVAVAKRLHDEGVSKGKSSALLEVGRGWLPRYADATLSPEEESGLVERVLAELDRLAEARERA
jgi:predicted transcriptional regulator